MTHTDQPGPPRIVLIHAVTVAVDPILTAFKQHWPVAEYVNVQDDSLARDRERSTELTAAMAGRIDALADYGHSLGARAILFTCSAFGSAIERAAARLPIPVLKPNEAMFAAALDRGARIGMLATFGPSVASLEQEFRELASACGKTATIETICVPEAMAALRAGDAAGHNALLAAKAPGLTHCDAILLAHFSTSRAESAVARAVAVPVLTSPASAVLKLKSLIARP